VKKNPLFIELENVYDMPKESKNLYDGPMVHRNFQCPEYNDCLTNAAFQNRDLHCRNCLLRETKQNTSIAELEI
jgi:hypothetical protein